MVTVDTQNGCVASYASEALGGSCSVGTEGGGMLGHPAYNTMEYMMCTGVNLDAWGANGGTVAGYTEGVYVVGGGLY